MEPSVENPDDSRTRALAALELADGRTRDKRAERLVCVSAFDRIPQAVIGRYEQLALLDEVRSCFIDGRLIATLLLAAAFIEQTLVEELESVGDLRPRHTLHHAIQSARSAGVASDELLDKANLVRQARNPFVHFRSEGDANRLPSRVRARGVHQRVVVEEDAGMAVRVAYDLFRATLKSVG